MMDKKLLVVLVLLLGIVISGFQSVVATIDLTELVQLERNIYSEIDDLSDSDRFGFSTANLGDLDGDGKVEIAVGAIDGGPDREGAVYIVSLDSRGNYDPNSYTEISKSTLNNVLDLSIGDDFGSSIAYLGDLDSDSKVEIAVGAFGDKDGSNPDSGHDDIGAIYIISLNLDGSYVSHTKISADTDNDVLDLISGSTDGDDTLFGSSIAYLGDLDSDGNIEVAVGASRRGSTDKGAVYIISLNQDGSYFSHEIVSVALYSNDLFGYSVSYLGDLDSDGDVEIAVGARTGGDSSSDNQGAVYIVSLDSSGSYVSHTKISVGTLGNTLGLAQGDMFGSSIAYLGDLDGDGKVEIAVGAKGNDEGSLDRVGAVHIISLNLDGTYSSSFKLSDTQGGFTGLLEGDDRFGTSLTTLGDEDVFGLLVGMNNINGGDGIWYLHFDPPPVAKYSFEDSVADSLGRYDGVAKVFSGSNNYFDNGISGKSLFFDGTKYVEISDFPDLDEVSISLWQFGSVADIANTQMHVIDSTSTSTIPLQILIPWTDEKVYWKAGSYVDDASTADSVVVTDATVSSNVYTNKWNHWVFTKKDDMLDIYLNGELLKTEPENVDVISPIDSLYIGASSSGDKGYVGFLDEIVIYNPVLSATEVTEIYEEYIAECPESATGSYPSCVCELTLGHIYDRDSNTCIDCVASSSNPVCAEIQCTDNDGDGYVQENFNTCPTGGSTYIGNDDCFDVQSTLKPIHPGAREYCDSVDNDCDLVTDELCANLNDDTVIDVYDYNLFLDSYYAHLVDGTNLEGDLDTDGDVDVIDYDLFIASFNTQ
jgi:hypothetical protein